MNPVEAAAVLRKTLAYCPSQSVDAATPDAWAEALDDIRLVDALDAVRLLGRRELEPGKARYIEPGHIRAEVRRLRTRRVEMHPPIDPPSGMSPAQLHAWQHRTRQAIADGDPVAVPALPPADPARLASLRRRAADA